MKLAKSFAACTLAPITRSKNGIPSTVKVGTNGKFQALSFFIDSSGHSNVIMPLELRVSCQEDLDMILSSGSILPKPSNIIPTDGQESEVGGHDVAAPTLDSSFIGFEAKTSSDDTATKVVVVEAISILSTSVKDLVITFEIEVTVRAFDQDQALKNFRDDVESSSVFATLEITPVLTIKKVATSDSDYVGLPDLTSLELGAIRDHMQRESSIRLQETRLDPLILDVTLAHAFTISVKSVQGPTLGNTMVSLTIRHSNLHREIVTISNIAIHPGHSRYETAPEFNRRNVGSKYAVTNMTKAVQWGYAPRTELRLPLTLNPYDAYSTVLVMNGGEEMMSRSFTSPVSVTGVVGRSNSDIASSSSRGRVVVAADAHWATELVAVEPADAFRVDMKVSRAEVKLGEPMVVSLRIFNLSLEPRILMLFLAKEEHQDLTERDEAVNTAVVSDMNGCTFGVWGISGEDDGTVKLNRDYSLLAVDGGLALGEVLGQHAVDADLRFVPLREGCLKVPFWKLYDKTNGKWYTCAHNLRLVAEA